MAVRTDQHTDLTRTPLCQTATSKQLKQSSGPTCTAYSELLNSTSSADWKLQRL